MQQKSKKVIVVGGGPAGIMAAAYTEGQQTTGKTVL